MVWVRVRRVLVRRSSPYWRVDWMIPSSVTWRRRRRRVPARQSRISAGTDRGVLGAKPHIRRADRCEIARREIVEAILWTQVDDFEGCVYFGDTFIEIGNTSKNCGYSRIYFIEIGNTFVNFKTEHTVSRIGWDFFIIPFIWQFSLKLTTLLSIKIKSPI